MLHVAQRTSVFSESVIREMTRLAIIHGAINLAQGYPDFPAPAFIKQAAIDAINADINQYAITWALPGCAPPSPVRRDASTASTWTRTAR